MFTCRGAINRDGTYEIRDFTLPTPAPVAASLISKPPTMPTPSVTTTVVAQGLGHMVLACLVMAKIHSAAQIIGTGDAQDQSRFETIKALGPDAVHRCLGTC